MKGFDDLRGNLIINDFFCTQCGFKISLPRKKSKKREGGHLKKIYCCTCKKEVNFVECNNINYCYADYKQEIKDGVFENSDIRKEL